MWRLRECVIIVRLCALIRVQKRPFFVYNAFMSVKTLEEMQTAVHAALVQWGKSSESEMVPLAELQLVQNQLATNKDGLPFGVKHAVDQVLLDSINLLAQQNETSANVLQSRFIDGKITRQVAQDLHASIDQINRWQRTAIDTLTQILYHQETNLWAELAQQLEASLPPPPYSRFFGFAEARQRLAAQLVQKQPPWIVALTGMGGIGKTSLADAVIREVLPSLAFKQIYWLSLESQQLSGDPLPPDRAYQSLLVVLAEKIWSGGSYGESTLQIEKRLFQTLKAEPCLIIIDNLETIPHVDYLAYKFLAFTEPTRFLFTSRARPSGETAVYIHTLPELPFTDAEALIRHHAHITGLTELSEANSDVIEAIYNVTGGNPLALKLVVGLTGILPLPQILTDLTVNRSGPIEDLYRHIYWQTWQTLTPSAQQLLQAMPLAAASGARAEQMQAFSGLDTDDFWAAVRELTSRSLLDVQGTIQERRYGIHRLTETFLQTEIIKWPEQLES